MRGSENIGDNQTLVINNAIKGYSALNRSMDADFGKFQRFSIGFFICEGSWRSHCARERRWSASSALLRIRLRRLDFLRVYLAI